MEWWVYALIAAYVMVGLAFTIRAIGYNPPKSDIINNDLGGCGCLILLVLVSLFSLLVIAVFIGRKSAPQAGPNKALQTARQS